MKLAARTVLSASPICGVVALFAIVGCTAPVEVKVPAYERPVYPPATEFKYVPIGMSGCLASTCHGGPATDALAGKLDKDTWQGSGSCWAAADPHTASYSLLTEHPHRRVKVTAKQIMERYAPGTEAVNDARCIACHTNPALATASRLNDPHARLLRNEGVSCEACHGGAGGWVTEHTTWKGDRSEVYARTGMVPLYDLGERALTCAGCHVGAPEDKVRGLAVRDMNHDMIAAGHPRLNFDFAEYLRRLPVHWWEKDRKTNKGHPLNPAKAWLVGRVAHAEAACKLLASRAERSKTDGWTPWPEFAEFNCAACHHHLRAGTKDDPNWRQDPDNLGERPPGATPWQTIWPITPAAGIMAPSRSASDLKAVLEVMEARRWPNPSRAESAASASAVQLRKRLRETVDLTDDEAVRQLNAKLLLRAPHVPEWDSATQMFFGAAALERSRQPALTDVPKEFRQILSAFQTQNWKEVTELLNKIREIQKARP